MSQTVLVVDDSKTIRNVVSMALKVAPFETVGAGSVKEALKAIGDDTAMVLLDYHLPEVSGYEICRRLKDHEQTAGIPIVMMAGSAHGFDEEKAHQAGADRIIPKPFNTDTLLDAVVAATGTSKKSLVKRSVSREPAAEASPQDTSSKELASEPPQAPPAPEPDSEQQAPSPDSDSGPPTAPGASPDSDSDSDRGQSGSSSGASTPRFSPDTGSTSAANPLSSGEAGSEVTTNPSNASGSSVSGSSVSHAEAPEPDTVPGESAGAGDETTFAAGASEDQLNERIRQEVKDVVREQLPKVLRKVMGEVFQKRVLPKLMEHAEKEVDKAVDDALDEKIEQQVRAQIEQLLEE